MNRKHQTPGAAGQDKKPTGTAPGLSVGRLGNKQWKAMGSYGTIGLEFVLSIMLGLFGGRWLDGKFDTGPWLAVLGFGFGLAAGVRAIWRAWSEMQAITRQEEKEEGNPAPMYPKKDERDVDETSDESSDDEESSGDDDGAVEAGEEKAGEADKKPRAGGKQ